MSREVLRFIDLFAGIGGTRLAFERNGLKCVFSSEWDVFAQRTYEANFGERPYGDITKISSDEIPDFEILVGGFPCQPFSSIGKRAGFEHATQGTLFFEIARILKDKSPQAFLLENVKGLTHHDNGKTLEVIAQTIDSLGYQLYQAILDSADYGVPQHRERIYLVGFKRGVEKTRFTFPTPSKKQTTIEKHLESGVDDRSISLHLQEKYIFKKDDGRPQIVSKTTKTTVKTLVSTYHKIQRLTGTFVADGPTGLRLFTENECKAVMGFPKNFKTPVSRTQMFRQFGNSVAVPVVQKIAEQMLISLRG